MKKAGFESVQFTRYNRPGIDYCHIEYLTHKKLCSGKRHNGWSYIPSDFCVTIKSFESYSVWAHRTEEMVKKISEIKLQVEEMKEKRNSLSDSIKAVSATSNKETSQLS